ncbi:LOW QUALITY PROTEIN: uncharacterized protein LOC111056619 [Nilaparvata lugens]|uniref:LOW QUALITY PROTEIN: uncharacterized protein LOC111056619 n=1 Tax=Nilaparvata lugens TaxID=108931 RepID=UPI00193CBC75|nr:LOW QUALITY PROTEIN: uncharacterized protein LOC111056619 [Nilaparvata lugens]
MMSSFKILFSTLLICLQCSGNTFGWKGGTQWASPEMEALDERHDQELLKAVQESMAAWERRKASHSHRQKRADSPGVCYDGVGCFKESGPYGYIDMLPSSPEEVDTRFLMYSSKKNRRSDTPLLDVGFANLTAVYTWAGKAFNVSAPTKVIVHGFGSSCSHVWVYEMRSALMSVEECNVICVDWEKGATFPNYVRAAANTRLVGKQLSMLIAGLHEKLHLPLHKVHIIGFSLGAHVAGFAGAQLKNISRITGLDPAGPLFESQDPRARLDSSDASFVDVIHSNGENLILGGLGSWQPMGHVDYYPNGGRMQKGCSNLFVGAVTDILWSVSEAEGRSLCNHRRAYKFFTDSVSPRCHFPALSCDSFDKYLAGNCFPCTDQDNCGNMGYYADKAKGRGTLYLVTRDEEPFCANQYLARVESTPSVLPVVSYGKIQLTLIGDGDLNETFTLTTKDDDELSVGGALSRIIVPHPAVRHYVALQILYTAYSGWISSGLARWSIDKIILVDSLGQSLSVCKRGLVLESGIAALLPLYPGNCKHQSDSTPSVTWNNNVTLPKIPSDNTTRYIPTQVVHLGDEIVFNSSLTDRKQNGSDKHDDNYLSYNWQPVPEYPEVSGNSGNDLESTNLNLEDVGRGFLNVKQVSSSWNSTRNTTGLEERFGNNTTLDKRSPGKDLLGNATRKMDDKKERILRKDEPYKFEAIMLSDEPVQTGSTSSGNDTTTRPEIKEPILPSTTPRVASNRSPKSDLTPPSVTATESWYHWESSTNNGKKTKKLNLDSVPSAAAATSNETSPERSLVVQLFPQRLVSLLEQAERYARLAFSPFVSQGDNSESRVQRMLKYLPTFWTHSDQHAASSAKRANRHIDVAKPGENQPDNPYKMETPDPNSGYKMENPDSNSGYKMENHPDRDPNPGLKPSPGPSPVGEHQTVSFDNRGDSALPYKLQTQQTLEENSKVVAIPYKLADQKRVDKFHPKFIPVLHETDKGSTEESPVKVVLDFNRPEGVVDHMETPLAQEESEYEGVEKTTVKEGTR